jgi:hypothetical protein
MTTLADRVRETTTTTGTGSLTLAGASFAYQSFDDAFGSGASVPYCVVGGADWEVGVGTFTAPSTLARTSVLASSNSGSAVNFPAGTKEVFCTLPASLVSDPAWTALSGRVHPKTTSDAVIIGATAAAGSEKLRVVGSTLLEGPLDVQATGPSSVVTSSGALTLTAAAASTWKTNAGALTLESAAAATWRTAAGALTVDSAAALQLGTTNATSLAVGKSGITTTVTGDLTQQTGALTLTPNAASQIVTSSGALTITAAAASTWKTAAGALTLESAAAATWKTAAGALTVDSAAGLSLGVSSATRVDVGKSGITTTVTGGLSQQTGAVSLTANAASQVTTSSGALTLTGAAASTWKTTSGALTLESAASATWGTASGALTLAAGGSNSLFLTTNASKRLVAGASGGVAIGDSAPGTGIWLDVQQPVHASTVPVAVKVSGGAHTSCTAGQNVIDVHLALNRTVGLANGSPTTLSPVMVQAPTYSATSGTITNLFTVAIDAAPALSGGIAATNTGAFWIAAGLAKFDGGLLATTGRFTSDLATPYWARQGSDLALASTTLGATDLALVLPIGSFIVRAVVRWTNGAATHSGIKTDFSTSGAMTTSNTSRTTSIHSVTNGTILGCLSNTNLTTTHGANGAASEVAVLLVDMHVQVTAAGTLTLRAARNSAGTTNTTLLANSSIWAMRQS